MQDAYNYLNKLDVPEYEIDELHFSHGQKTGRTTRTISHYQHNYQKPVVDSKKDTRASKHENNHNYNSRYKPSCKKIFLDLISKKLTGIFSKSKKFYRRPNYNS